MAELLFEIGCEELPAPWLPGLREQLQKRFAEAAEREHLSPRAIVVHSTPRRLVLFGEVLARQEDREEAVFGPPLKVARDASGAWTGAATGFARKNGTTPETLQLLAKDPAAPDDLYLLFTRKTVGRPAQEVLPALFAATLRALAFPKRMSWDAWLDDGKGAFPFGRPIRWILGLVDSQVVPFTIYELVAGKRGRAIVESASLTRGHRFLPRGAAGAPIAVSGASDFRERLRGAFVILDPAEREVRIREGLAAAGEVRDDHGLIEEWRELVEYPTVVSGSIPGEFASLPVEVLETVLVHHQKYIPLVGDTRALSRFAAPTGADEAASPAIVRGMERVVVARLRDGAFFFAEDMKRPLSDRIPDLTGVTFHQKLGSYREKADRMVRLVDAMGNIGLLNESEHRAASEAARLAKADLTSLMVREFPELQGIMGGVYLRAQGIAAESVAAAVQWHYHPMSIEENSPPLPSQVGDPKVFGAVSVADKLDTLVGYFGIGEDPTGSRDPYGLRRAAQGVIRVLLDFWQVDAAEVRPSLPWLIEAAIAGYQATLALDAAARKRLDGALKLFLLDRLEYVLVSRGYAADEVAAVLYTDPLVKYALDDPYDCLMRVQALQKVRAEMPQDFEHLAVAFKRANSLLTQAQEKQFVLTGVLPGSEEFKEPAERHLYDVLMAQDFGPSGGLSTYEQQFRALATRRPAVDRFFDEVMVMVDDGDVRARRLALLNLVVAPILRIADISRLGGQA